MISTRDFLRTLFGGALLAPFLWMTGKRKSRKPAFLWQIDPDKCIQCGKCETACVLGRSAVKCVHQYAACGYCLFCSGYYQDKRVKFDTAAENLRCPTDAIKRKYIDTLAWEIKRGEVSVTVSAFNVPHTYGDGISFWVFSDPSL